MAQLRGRAKWRVCVRVTLRDCRACQAGLRACCEREQRVADEKDARTRRCRPPYRLTLARGCLTRQNDGQYVQGLDLPVGTALTTVACSQNASLSPNNSPRSRSRHHRVSKGAERLCVCSTQLCLLASQTTTQRRRTQPMRTTGLQRMQRTRRGQSLSTLGAYSLSCGHASSA